MKYRPLDPPRTQRERLGHDVAKERDNRLDAFEALARDAGLSDQQIQQGRGSLFEGVGTLNSKVVVRFLPTDAAEKLLPLGLELAPQPVAPVGRHPVFFLFSNCEFDAWFGDMKYAEFMLGVPYVQLEDPHAPQRGPFIYMPRLYLNEQTPRLLGNLLYGFEKQEAEIREGPGTYEVIEDSALVLDARFETSGPQGTPSDFPEFETVKSLFEMPTISQVARIWDEDAFDDREHLSAFFATNIRYAFDDPQCRVTPLEARVEVTAALTPEGVPTGAFDAPALGEHALGSFHIEVPQVVSLPGSPCKVHYARTRPTRKQRVVVLGGGPSACAAAFYLAKQQDRYEVELYTQGWRMGGKCGAGRNLDAANRIEEHGLHAFIGFYQNAFRTVREIYEHAELPLAVGQPPYDHENHEGPFAAAFIGHDDIGVFDRWNDQWCYFKTPQTYRDSAPGDIPRGEWDYPPFLAYGFKAALEKVLSDLTTFIGLAPSTEEDVEQEFAERKHAEEQKPKEQSVWQEFWEDAREALEGAQSSVKRTLDSLVNYLEDMALERIAQDIEEGRAFYRGLSWLLGVLRKGLKRAYASKIEGDKEAWYVWTNLDLVLTILIGIIDDKAVHFDVLDDWDFRQWLLHHGLDPANGQIASITQVYETLFAHGSERAEPDELACGVALRWFVLVGFLWNGWPVYDFKYSCPQTLITPYYLALKKLGVKVHFFHRVTELEVEGSGDERRLGGIRMQVQATVKGGSDAYQPLLPDLPGNPPGQPDWPIHPHWDQLEEGEALKAQDVNLENVWSTWQGAGEKVLRQGPDGDFDLCVLGIPLAALPKLTKPLTDPQSPSHDPRWAAMFEHMKVTETISTQLWLKKPATELYRWKLGLMTSYALPEPSFADFSHLVQWERWEGSEAARFCAYHTGSLTAISVAQAWPDETPDYPDRQNARWREHFRAWLHENYRGLYTEAPERFEDFLEWLAIPESTPTTGIDRLWAQYFNQSSQPSDLYVLSQPKTNRHRMGQGESGVAGLFLCGDWTRTDLNCGCVEASTQSGMLAARVISNEPSYVWHPGF